MICGLSIFGLKNDEIENSDYFKYSSILNFGKYNNNSVEDVLKNDAGYLTWCLFNVTGFTFSKNLFDNILKKVDGIPMISAITNIHNKNYSRFLSVQLSLRHYLRFESGKQKIKFIEENGWKDFDKHFHLCEDFIDSFIDEVDWGLISRHWNLNNVFIQKYSDRIDWVGLLTYQEINEQIIDENIEKVKWDHVCKYQKVSQDFIDKHINNIHWYAITKNSKIEMTKGFVEKYIEYLYIVELLDREDVSDEIKEEIRPLNNADFFEKQTIKRKQVRSDFKPNKK